ncbi:glycosyltransferase family 4 protein [Clostridium perfringens]|uniref:glycosyltransferase family 4 protein n=1 Tax=Clostridium perfringens TaxID=1502 RepID=UPI0018E47C18|nr:glycosyltransferase family 4 protein [Clostridium perfringens]ELC8413681.1 glycosyltransferase family 4 protein [Clostridium perfringens]MBI6007232.1 glycosyltransferase family 4 protein [Clostridium perfringens]MDM0605561.1 glycosyltransferase family 4 protein [Clostridium perfringens]MDM0638775.1 glycosyltransferase family 4 protein [Clostridium perfringens]HAT4166203.1 glycosyltransferase family 4 protein [Clostridium perfringens]
MKLLYIASVDFYTKPNPSYHLMTTMLEDILNSGIEIYFIGCEECGLKTHIPKNLLNNKGFTYKLVPTPSIKKSSFIRRYLEGMKYSFKASKYIKQIIDECDIVFVQSSPTVLYTLYYVKKYIRNQKIIYNVQDMFPGSSIASGVMPKKWMQDVFFYLQKIAYKKADCIIAISEDMKIKLKEQGVDEDKIKVIVNWFDDKSVHSVDWNENRFVKKYNMSLDKFYVQYAGTMGYVFDYKMVVKVAEILKEDDDIVFQMIGDGSQKNRFMEEVEQKKLNNIIFYPLEPQYMVSDVYSSCSVCIIPLKEGIIGNSVPSKAGLLMACKKAIITSVDDKTDYYNMINNNHIGIAVSNKNATAVAQGILMLKNNRNKCRQYGLNGYNYGHILYSRTNNMNKYIRLFNDCVINNK